MSMFSIAELCPHAFARVHVPFRSSCQRAHLIDVVARAEGNKRLADKQALERKAAADKSSKGSAPEAHTESLDWGQSIPSYLQTTIASELCDEWSNEIEAAEAEAAEWQRAMRAGEDPDTAVALLRERLDDELFAAKEQKLWNQIRKEAAKDISEEPILSSFLYASILAHSTFAEALAFVLSNRVADATMLPTQLFSLFISLMEKDPDVLRGAVADLEAVHDRDPACLSYSCSLLYFKGYHAIQIHRLAHALWKRGRTVMSLSLQSRLSEVLAVDIHPAAQFGFGLLFDHGTGVVIGETAVIGSGVSLMQNVTLGGTGKDIGDRHPKIGNNVLIGTGAAILGNIIVGAGAQVAAGSLVLKPVEPHTMVAGSPARYVGPVTGNPAKSMDHWSSEFRYNPAKQDILADGIKTNQPTIPTPTGYLVRPYSDADYSRQIHAELNLYDSTTSTSHAEPTTADTDDSVVSSDSHSDPVTVQSRFSQKWDDTGRAIGKTGTPDKGVVQNRKVLDRMKGTTVSTGGVSIDAGSDGIDATLSDKIADDKWGSQATEPEFSI